MGSIERLKIGRDVTFRDRPDRLGSSSS